MIKKVMLLKELKKIDINELNNNGFWFDCDTYMTQFKLTKSLKKLISNRKGFFDNAGEELNFVTCEYWVDKNKFVYLLSFEDDVIDITDKISCDFINNIITDLSMQ